MRAPTRYCVIKHPDEGGGVVKKYDMGNGDTLPKLNEGVVSHPDFSVVGIDTHDEFQTLSCDRSDLSSHELRLLGFETE